MIQLKTVDDSNETIIIHRSRFICRLFYINDLLEVTKKLQEVKQKYVGATHYCYAYILDQQKRFSDDQEPSGTAGMPILNVLENQHLNHVLCVVIRYFGGIKLGAGGLVRAYTKAVTSCLKKTNIFDLQEGKKIKITFSYDKSKLFDELFKEEKIQKNFSDNITYIIQLTNQKLSQFQKIIELNSITFEVMESILVKIKS